MNPPYQEDPGVSGSEQPVEEDEGSPHAEHNHHQVVYQDVVYQDEAHMEYREHRDTDQAYDRHPMHEEQAYNVAEGHYAPAEQEAYHEGEPHAHHEGYEDSQHVQYEQDVNGQIYGDAHGDVCHQDADQVYASDAHGQQEYAQEEGTHPQYAQEANPGQSGYDPRQSRYEQEGPSHPQYTQEDHSQRQYTQEDPSQLGYPQAEDPSQPEYPQAEDPSQSHYVQEDPSQPQYAQEDPSQQEYTHNDSTQQEYASEEIHQEYAHEDANQSYAPDTGQNYVDYAEVDPDHQQGQQEQYLPEQPVTAQVAYEYDHQGQELVDAEPIAAEPDHPHQLQCYSPALEEAQELPERRLIPGRVWRVPPLPSSRQPASTEPEQAGMDGAPAEPAQAGQLTGWGGHPIPYATVVTAPVKQATAIWGARQVRYIRHTEPEPLKGKRVEKRPFEAARQFVWSLQLPSRLDYQDWANSSERPPDIPKNPDTAYANRGWVSWPDWLGTGLGVPARVRKRTADEYRPFEEARQFAWAMGFASKDQFRQWSKSGERPPDFPGRPDMVYASEWLSWADFLGKQKGKIRTIPNRKKPRIEYRPFELGREYVRSLGFKQPEQYTHWARSSRQRPRDIPRFPEISYAYCWTSWPNFLGTEKTPVPPARRSIPFEEAREYIWQLGFKDKDEYRAWASTIDRPRGIPKNPNEVYADEGWLSWEDWLGSEKGRRARVRRRRGTDVLPFEPAREYVRTLHFRGKDDYREWSKRGDRPLNVPSRPDIIYKDQGWIDWLDFLGKPQRYVK
eukprot:jgi/Chlat1/9215/Chrsp98S08475